MKLSNKAIVVGQGNKCPKCGEAMERRKHPSHYVHRKSYFYTEWDYCKKDKHVQHYEEFKSPDWKKEERRIDFVSTI